MTIKILLTGATGYIAAQILPTFREIYDVNLVDVKAENASGESVEGVVVADLINPSRIFYWIEKLINFLGKI